MPPRSFERDDCPFPRPPPPHELMATPNRSLEQIYLGLLYQLASPRDDPHLHLNGLPQVEIEARDS